jgi:hypothetical protein
MTDFDIEAIRAEVRAMHFTRGTPAEVAMWGSLHESEFYVR